jgi:peptidoglycan/xylan/chitin deacetylase (PgdA/CDA1 family)
MGKRQVISTFVALAVVWLALAGALGAKVGGITGDIIFGAALILVLLVAFAAFTPNTALFGRVIGRGKVDAPKAAITFDDGPSAEHTPHILDELRDAGVRATFFVLGRHVRAHPEIARRIVEEGHELASHGDDHTLLTFQGPTRIAHQLRALDEAVVAATGTGPAPLFRAPHGFRSPFLVPVARRLGYRVVGWTAGVWDTAKPGIDRIVQRSVLKLHPGAILLLHDADGSGNGDDRSQTVAALPQIIQAGKERGLQFVTVSELAAELRPHRRMAVRAIAIAGLLAAGVFLLSTKLDLKSVGGVITDANPTFVFAALAANLLSVAGKGLTWKAALDAVDDVPTQDGGTRHLRARFSDVVPAIFIGFLLNTVLFARLGEVARVSVLRRKLVARGYDVPVPTLVGTLVTEQLLSGVTLVAVLLGVAAFVSIPGWAGKLLLVLIGVVLVIAVSAAAIEVWARYRRRQVPAETDPVEHWWHLLGISLSAIPLAMREGQAVLRKPKLLLWGLTTAALSWLAQMLGIYWALEAYGIHEGVGAAALVFLASNLVGLFPIVPGNLVVFQGATYTALQVYNVPTNLAITFGIGLQIIEALLGVGLGFFFLSYEGLSVGELRNEAEASAVMPDSTSPRV